MTTLSPEDDAFYSEMAAYTQPNEYSFGGVPVEELALPEGERKVEDVNDLGRNPMSNPAAANAAISSIVGPGPTPEIDPPADDTVILPGGYLSRDGLVRTAQVRELTGEDEEALAKAVSSPAKFTATLLRAVEYIGAQPATRELLNELLVGDREALVLGIRVATFGKEITYENVDCVGCGEKLAVTIDLSDLPVRKLEDPEKREFEVPLRRDKVAVVRLPTGADSQRVIEEQGTLAEENTLLLSRCVISIDGKKVNNSREAVKKLGVQDRQTIINFMAETAPGPRYDEVKSLHEDCGAETPIYLAVEDLFRGL